MSPTRQAAVAGRFYPAGRQECVRALDEMARPANYEGCAVGAIVPHAGWGYSGPTAALSIGACARAEPETVVLFGAVHSLDTNDASLYESGCWETPLGSLTIDEELASRIAEFRHVKRDFASHRSEHSIEVQLPLVLHLLGNVRIVPIGVRPGERAAAIGRACAELAGELGRRVLFIGSTDLTHYGPVYGFEPHGRGRDGVRWAKEVNDRRFIDLLAALNAEEVVPEASIHRNACGAGAVAATIAAAAQAGADRYVELEHTTSADRELLNGGNPVNSVGYEGGVFTRPE